MEILVGYTVGSGAPVTVPLKHMAVTGQTQESGKTTTLEALTSRMQGHAALAFVTKRGESAFADARRVQPYFHDRADWQFVTSLLDATLQEKNKFLRPWIMKICRTTKTLADVQREVQKALKTAKGINEGVYTQLDAYLDLIVPEIQRARLAPTLDLVPGTISVMDISGFSTPMQMLFVQSAIDVVNELASETVVIVPEAWEFIPEGKGSPVKNSAVSLVRKGAGIGNFIWVDSQDMAGVDKTILRGCAVWLIGVQREANEIKRNLSNIPKGIKRPSAAEVAMLERGQFYVCWGSHAVKTYVRPEWMPANDAIAVAKGTLRTPAAPKRPIIQETKVTESEARELREENERLRARIAALEAPSSNEQLSRDASAEGRRVSGDAGSTPVGAEVLYQEIRDRLLREPAVLRVLAMKPQIDVEIKRETVVMDGKTWIGRVAAMIADGFFDEARKSSVVFREATRCGATGVAPRADEACKKLLALGFLTREDDGFRAVPGMKVNIVER